MRFNYRESSLFKDVLWVQWIAGLGALLSLFVNGLMVGWSSPYLARLTAPDSPLPITTAEASWVASYLSFGRIFGAPIGAIGAQYFGSKKTTLFVGFPLILCWIFVIVADSVIWLYAARISCGVSLGIAFSSFPLYLGEISSPKIRGALVSLAMSGMMLGNLMGNVMGAYVDMDTFAYVSLVPNLVFVLLFLWLPESPHYLVRLNRMEEAKLSIARYNPKADVDTEAESVKNFAAAATSLTFMDRLRELCQPRNRKAAMILVTLHFFMQFSGLNSLSFYMETILTSAKLTAVAPATMVMIIGSLGVPASLMPIYLNDKYGRKKLMAVSSAGVSVALIALGAHFALIDGGYDSERLQWLPCVALIVYQTFICAGIVPIPNTVLSELFAPNIKTVVACFSSLAIGGFAFAATKSYQPLVNTIGEAYVFWTHAVVMVCSFLYATMFMLETKGKTLQEIQYLLAGK